MTEQSTPVNEKIEIIRIKKAFQLAIIGILILAILVPILTLMNITEDNAKAAMTIIQPFLTVLGTLVGAFFGLQIGQADKDKAENEKEKAEEEKTKAQAKVEKLAASIGSEGYEDLVEKYKDLFSD